MNYVLPLEFVQFVAQTSLPKDADNWAVVVTVIPWLLALFLGISGWFKEYITEGFLGSCLKVTAPTSAPYSQKSFFLRSLSREDESVKVSCYHFRIVVENVGKTLAESVEVFVTRLCRRNSSGDFDLVESFVPMNLNWAHVDKGFADFIAPDTHKLCNLVSVWRDEDLTVHASLVTEVTPVDQGNRIQPGTYRAHVIVSTKRGIKAKGHLNITFAGQWHDSLAAMVESNALTVSCSMETIYPPLLQLG
jgi:hypothetical protein